MRFPTRSIFSRTLARFRSSVAANVATMTALTLPFALILGAIAIDEGALYTERRDVQALADLAAITGAANIGKAEEAVLKMLRDNGVDRIVMRQSDDPLASGAVALGTVIVTIDRGNYVASPTVSVQRRFASGKAPYNAVKVTLQKDGTRYFASSLIDAPRIGTQATASATSEAAFSVGSRLLRVEGGILNALLGTLLGGNVSLKVMDYEALIAADIDMLSFVDSLATKLNVRAGTYDEVLQSKATVGQIASAMAEIGGLDQTARLALAALALDASRKLDVPLSQLIDLGSVGRLALGERPAGLSATANALEMLTAAAAVANGENQVRLNLGANVPGLLAVTVDLAIGGPPQRSTWFAIGEAGTIVRTAQTRLLVTVEVGGPGGLLGASIKLPIYVELAFAEAKLTDISCTPGSPQRTKVKVAARPGIALLRIAETSAGSLADFRNPPPLAPAKLVKTPLVSVEGQAKIEVANLLWADLTFDRKDIDQGTIKTVSTRDFTESLTASLLGNLKLDIKAAGLGLGLPGGLAPAIEQVLGKATPQIDDLLYSLLSALGVRLGEADVRVTGVSCGRSVLVQ